MVAILPPERERLDRADNLRRSGSWNQSFARVADWIEKYRLYRVDKVRFGGENSERYAWVARCLGAWPSMTEAKAAAEELSTEYDETLAGRKRIWRDRPMSEAQANYLRRLGAFQPGLTSGSAAQRISHVLTRQAVKQAEQVKQKELIRRAQVPL